MDSRWFFFKRSFFQVLTKIFLRGEFFKNHKNSQNFQNHISFERARDYGRKCSSHRAARWFFPKIWFFKVWNFDFEFWSLGVIFKTPKKYAKFPKSHIIWKSKRLWEKMLKSSSCPMILSRDMIFQSVKFWPQILVPRGILQKSQISRMFPISYDMNEEESTRSMIQPSWMPDDYLWRYGFPKFFSWEMVHPTMTKIFLISEFHKFAVNR